MTFNVPLRGTWSDGSLPVAQWPSSDAITWQASLENDDPDDRGALGHLSAETHLAMRKAYGQLLSWMRKVGRLDPTRSGTDQLTADLLGEYLIAARAALSDLSVHHHLGTLSTILKRLAPASDWRWICRHRRAPRPREARAARKPPRTFDVGILLHRLLTELERLDGLPWGVWLANRRRDCLILAVAVYTGLRRRNLSGLVIGRTFIRGSVTWSIRYDAGESKTGAPILMKLPPLLVCHIDRYVEVDRPRLIGNRSCNALWVSRSKLGPALKPSSISDACSRLGQEMIGQRISSHQPRYSAATTWMRMDPRAAANVSGLLVHSDADTLFEFYDQSGDAAAQAIWRDVVRKIRNPKP